MTTLAMILLVTGIQAGASPKNAELAEQVRAAETSFAKTMADRDHAAFKAHLADEAVFFGSKTVSRGRDAVAQAWKGLYEGPKAPFSWRPEDVQVLDSGTLGHSSGPVFDPAGKQIGTFNSIWRREPDGRWKVVFDKGCDACDCAPKPPASPQPKPPAKE